MVDRSLAYLIIKIIFLCRGTFAYILHEAWKLYILYISLFLFFYKFVTLMLNFVNFGVDIQSCIKLSEFRVVMYLNQLQIVNIIAEVIGHSCNHVGFTSPWRANTEGSIFQALPVLLVKRSFVGEVLKILHDLFLLVRVQRSKSMKDNFTV